VTLKLKTADFKTITRSSTLERPVHLSDQIYAEATELLRREKLDQKVRLVGVGVSNLEPATESGQLPLFDKRNAREKKWEKAERAMDEITERFGHGAVKRGSLLED
jgi:DNA polymerase-4